MARLRGILISRTKQNDNDDDDDDDDIATRLMNYSVGKRLSRRLSCWTRTQLVKELPSTTIIIR